MRPDLLRRMATVVIVLGLAAAGLTVHAAPNRQEQPPVKPAPSVPNPGERAFQENCSRCHRPPMALSPRITGTVVMHMRVRARLSRKDEELLLKYLAP